MGSAAPLLDFIGRIEPFRGLSALALQRLSLAFERRRIAAGELLFRLGDEGTSLFVLVEGSLDVIYEQPDGSCHLLASLRPGDCVGEMAVLTGTGRRAATVRAAADAELLELPRASLERAMEDEPALRAVIGQLVLRRLSGLRLAMSGLFGDMEGPLLRQLAESCSWCSLRRGEWLYRQGSPADAMYVIVHGRLKVLAEGPEDSGAVPLAVLGKGQPVGEMSLLTGEPRAAGVRAARDTGLVRLSRAGFEDALQRNPKIVLPLVRTAVHRLRDAASPGLGRQAQERTVNVAIMVLPPVDRSAVAQLAEALAAAGKVIHLTDERCDAIHGRGAARLPADDPRSIHLREWLDRLEAEHDFVLLETSDQADDWSRTCLRQADRILVFASAAGIPGTAPAERQLATEGSDVPRDLVLFHPPGTSGPSSTAAWRRALGIDRHHHVRQDSPRDLERVGRFLSGRAVGLVLGAGGARGFAHIGVIRAMRELDLPIDYVGGASMGAFIAALAAAEYSTAEMIRLVRQVLIAPPRSFHYTLPLLSMMRVDRAERRFRSLYGEGCIEDQWINFYCVSVNITHGEMAVHTDGPVWRAVRASLAIPGLLPPVFDRGELLVDGALVNSLPVDVMHRLCPGPTIACDVTGGAALRVDPQRTEVPSIGELLRSRLRPRRDDALPTMAGILTRCMDVSTLGTKQHNAALASVFLTPPVGKYNILDIGAVEELIETGYHYAIEELKGLDLGHASARP